MLKIAPAGGVSSARPEGCWVTSVQLLAICSPMRAVAFMSEGLFGTEQALEANEANNVATTIVKDER